MHLVESLTIIVSDQTEAAYVFHDDTRNTLLFSGNGSDIKDCLTNALDTLRRKYKYLYDVLFASDRFCDEIQSFLPHYEYDKDINHVELRVLLKLDKKDFSDARKERVSRLLESYVF